MEEIQIPDGYTLENQILGKEDDKGKISKEFTVLRKEGIIVFAQPVECATPERIERVIEQIEAVART